MTRLRLLLFLFFISSFYCFSQDSIPNLIPTDVLFKKTNRSHFSISPSGKYYVEVYEDNKDSYLFSHTVTLHIIDIDKYELIHRIPLDIFGIDALYWLSDERIIFDSKGSIKAVDIDGENRVEIASRGGFGIDLFNPNWSMEIHYNSILNLLRHKKDYILIQTMDENFHAAVKEVNIHTGEQVEMMNADTHKVNLWITDAYGRIRLGVKISEKGMRYYYKYDAETDTLKPFILKIGGNQYYLTIDPKIHLKQYLTFEGFAYDPDTIFITSNIFSDKRKLLSYDIEKEEVVETFVSDVNCDIKEMEGEGISFIFDYGNREIAGFKYTCLTPKYKWLSPQFAEKVNGLNKQYPGFFNEIIDLDISGNRLLVHQWNDSSPGNIGVYDVTEDSYAVMFYFNEELLNYELSKTKVVIARARDGHVVPCYFNLPVGAKEEEPVPLIVIPHGGPWARNYWRMDEFAQYFTSRGYATLRINYRGSTGFGKSHVLAGVHSLDEVMINDIADATQFIMERFPVDKDNVLIFGHSYGGYATYVGMAKYPALFKAGVSVAAPSDITAWMKKQKDDKDDYSYEFWNTALGTNDSDYLEKISPISYAPDINNPLLILHGRMDDIIPVEQAETMIEELKKHDKDFRSRIFNFSDHSFTDMKEFVEMLEDSDQFFKEYLNKEN